VRVDGQLAFNNVDMIVRAPKPVWLGFVMEDRVTSKSRMFPVRVLESWCPPFAGITSITPVAQPSLRLLSCRGMAPSGAGIGHSRSQAIG